MSDERERGGEPEATPAAANGEAEAVNAERGAGDEAGGLPLVVVIICRDNEGTIGGVIRSVGELARAVVVVDTGSEDGTREVARGLGARVLSRRWRGHVKTKQAALVAAAKTEGVSWIMHLDSDEPVTPRLAEALRRFIAEAERGRHEAVAGARVRRVAWYCGRPLEHVWQPEWRLRLVRVGLVRSGVAYWAGLDPHDRLEIDRGAGEVIDLPREAVLRHDSFATFADHLRQQVGHARVAAEALAAEGRGTTVLRMAASPVGAFLKQAVLKGGWKDGGAGWLAAASTAAGSLMKHMCLLELGAGRASGAGSVAGGGVSYTSFDRSTDGPAERPRDEPAIAAGERDGGGGSAASAFSKDRMSAEEQIVGDAGTGPDGAVDQSSDGGEPVKKKKRRRRRRKSTATSTAAESTDADLDAADGDDEPEGSRTLRTVKPVSEEAKRHVFDVGRAFSELGLGEALDRALVEAGWEHPTKIQAELIPRALAGRDVLGQAKTGSGKTAAFGLPLLKMIEPGAAFQGLILAPTRELALQIRDDLAGLGKHTGLKVTAVYGGQKISVQAAKLARSPEIIVGTPGRIMDMVGRRHLTLDAVRFAVLDEVDRMFDIGFRDDIKRILGMCPASGPLERDESGRITGGRQTIFVSATLSDEIERLAKKHMTDEERLIVTSGSLTVEMVKQFYVPVRAWDKRRMLHHLLTHESPDLTIVFCRMKRTVDDVAGYLTKKGIEAVALHGDLTQSKRNQAMKSFRHGELGVLIASDLAARGLDVDGISHVVNYDLPDDPDLYVHRIGRTARAGREGIAWSLVTPEQGGNLTEIELLINAAIPKLEYPDFDERPAPPDGWKPEPTGGRPVIEVTGVEQAKSRYADAPEVPAADKLSPEEIAAKFPGGVVPKAPPKKRLRGRMKTGRG